MIYNVNLPLQCKSSKNSRIIARRGGKTLLLKSQQLLNAEEEFLWYLKGQFKGTITKPCYLMVSFSFQDKRRHDLDNCLNFLMDILVKAEYLKDDNLITSIWADKGQEQKSSTVFTLTDELT